MTPDNAFNHFGSGIIFLRRATALEAGSFRACFERRPVAMLPHAPLLRGPLAPSVAMRQLPGRAPPAARALRRVTCAGQGSDSRKPRRSAAPGVGADGTATPGRGALPSLAAAPTAAASRLATKPAEVSAAKSGPRPELAAAARDKEAAEAWAEACLAFDDSDDLSGLLAVLEVWFFPIARLAPWTGPSASGFNALVWNIAPQPSGDIAVGPACAGSAGRRG